MADNDPTPMTNADVEPAAPGGDAQPASPVKGATAEDTTDANASNERPNFKTAAREGFAGFTSQASDKVRGVVEDGKAKAVGALDQVVQLLNDAAATVDDKLGAQYGDYARSAAEQVQGFSQVVQQKDADALLDEARGYVRQSPAIAIGVAAALGFAAARLVHSGLDNRSA